MSGPGGVLALDLSTSVGWAYGHPGSNAPPLCGVWLLATGDMGRMFASFDNELEDALTLHKPGLVMCEAPLPPSAVSNTIAWRHQLGLAALAEAAAYRHEVPYREQAVSTIRLDVLGSCRFPNGNAKPAVMAYCRSVGWAVPDHNAADACVLWLYACRNVPAARRLAA